MLSFDGAVSEFRPSPMPLDLQPELRDAASPVAPMSYVHAGAGGIDGRMQILPARHSPALRLGWALAQRQPLVILGISPGNAYFTRKRIEVAICGLASLFDDVVVVVPDTIAVHTYRALGYPEDQCHSKARTNGANLKNRCHKAIERARVENPSARVRLLDWERDLAGLPGYAAAYASVCRLFDQHRGFRTDVLAKGREVLLAKLGSDHVSEVAVHEAVNYLLKEFACFLLFQSAFGREVVVPYYQDFRLGQGFCDGTYQPPIPDVGWLMYAIELASDVIGEREVVNV